MRNIEQHAVLTRTADEKRHMILGRTSRLQILHGHSRMNGRTLIGHDEAGSSHIRDIEIVVRRVEINMVRLVEQRQRPHKIRRVEHRPRILDRIELNTRNLIQQRVHGVAIRHDKLIAMRPLNITHHLRQEFDPEFRQYILDFPTVQRPAIETLIGRYRAEKRIVVFRTRAEAEGYLRALTE